MVEVKLHICGYTIMSGSEVTKAEVTKVVNLMYPKTVSHLFVFTDTNMDNIQQSAKDGRSLLVLYILYYKLTLC